MKWLTVHVGGQRWRVDLVKGNNKNLAGGENEAVDGITYRDKCRIYIARELDEQAREDTLLHELLHATFQVSGVSNILDEVCGDFGKSHTTEEQMIRCLVPTWHRLLKDLGFKFPKVEKTQ